jgi:MFS-type transporter involved in bile tolerance (Atg22 family)
MAADKDEDRENLIAKEGGDDDEKSGKKEPEDPDGDSWVPYSRFVNSLFRRFDSSFVAILILENFNFGLWTMVSLASQDLFKAYMNEEPANMSVYNSIITLPWCFKIVFGLITDNVPLCGLRRKPYLVFFALVQFLMMLSLVLYDYESAMVVTMLLFTASLSMAFSNVVVDAILVVQARKDPYLGS